jgi:hypothetical protein
MKPTIFTLLVLTLAVESFAQTLPSNPLDAKYSPAAGSVFDVNSKLGKTSRSSSDGSDSKNFIGFNPSLLLRNIASLSYSRVLGTSTMARVSLGSCYNSDKIMAGSLLIPFEYVDPGDPTPDSKDESWFSFMLQDMTPIRKSSPFFEIGARFNGEDDVTNSMYLDVSYRNYSNSYVYRNSDISSGREFNLKMKTQSFQLISGRTFSAGSGGMHDIYIGGGLRVFSLDRLNPTKYSNTNTYEAAISEFSYGSDKVNTLFFSFLLGYTYHFGF